MGHKNIQHTLRYTELSPTRFKDFWRDSPRMQALRPKIIRPALPLPTKVNHFDHPGPRTLPSQDH
jgi:hypothetical protein